MLWNTARRLSVVSLLRRGAESCCTRLALHEVIIWDFECCDVCLRQCCWLLVKFINLGTSKLCLGVWKQQIVAAEGIEGQFWPYFSKFSRESSTIMINLPRGFFCCRYQHYFGCPGFVVVFNNYSISGDDSMSITSLLHRVPQILMGY